MALFSVCVVDDDPGIRKGVALTLGQEYDVLPFGSAEEALASLEEVMPDLVLLDYDLPGMNGYEALTTMLERHPEMLVMMITGYEKTEFAVTCMKAGAVDYVVKPLHMVELKTGIEKVLAGIRLKKEMRRAQLTALEKHHPVFIAESRAIKGAMEFVDQVARSPATPVLVSGETGTGKELVASAVHFMSPNFKGPFIRVNSASIPTDLIESELFGYGPGAFSGARPTGKKGLIQAAEGGTLFLDEIGDLSLAAQAKLLRFLENGSFFRLGESKEVSVSTRVVSATNRNLQTMVEEGTFRKDLYFRIGVVKVEVPSLNERKEDIIPLAVYFMEQFAVTFGKKVTGLDDGAMDTLKRHRWSGNVRELKNVMECAVLSTRTEVIREPDLGLTEAGAGSIPEPVEGNAFPPLGDAGMNLPAFQNSIETYYISQALALTKGNEKRAARLLGMSYHNFRYRRRKWNL